MIQSQAMKDTLVLNSVGITNGATNQTNAIDTQGCDYVTIRVALTNIVSATIASTDGVTIKLQESDDTNITNAVAITAIANKTGLKTARALRYEIDTKSRKRYLFPIITPGTSGVTNEPVTATVYATISRMEFAPGSTSDMVAGTQDVVIIA